MSLKMTNDISKKKSPFILKTTPSNSPTKTNDRIIKENQKYKNQIITLNDKINELNIILQNEKINNEKKENELVDKFQKENKKLKQKIDSNQDIISKIENSYKIKLNDLEKQKKINEQKNKNLLKKIDELTRNEKILNSDFDLQLKERIVAYKKSNQEYEKTISQLNSKIEFLISKNLDLESTLKSKELIIENLKVNEKEIKNRHLEEIRELNNKIKELKKKLEDLRNQ
jgi:chromosome segregation ATPase